MKTKTLFIALFCIFFSLLGSVCASDVSNVNNTDNLMQDNTELSSINLEVSSNDSISETNLVNSHDDNLSNYPNDDGALVSNDDSSHEDNGIKDSQYYSQKDIVFLDENSSSLPTNNETPSNGTHLVSQDIIMFFKNGTYYYVGVYDENNNPISNQTVSIILNGVTYERVTDENGIARLNINLNPGNYTVTASYANITVNNIIQILSTIEGNDIVKIYRNGTQYYALFLESMGNPLVNTNVTFNINGVFYTRTTNENGIARLNINLNPGSYILTAINPINNQTYSNNIVVLGSITGENIIKYFRNGTQYYAVFLDGMGNPLANTNVTFNINGVFYTRTTDENGTARLNINLNPGSYILTAINPINNQTYSNNIVVLPTLTGMDVIKYFRNGTQYHVYVVDGMGNPLANTNVTININGVFYTRTTDENGIATLNINLNPGTYILTVTNPNDGLMLSNTVTVYRANTIVSGNDTYVLINGGNFTIILTDAQGNPIVSEEVYFTINGNTYHAQTNEYGEASIEITNLPVSDYLVEYGFFGNSGYYSSQGNNTIHVIESNVIISGSDMIFIYGEGGRFSVTLTDIHGNLLANRTVSFQINGVTYYRTTDENGVAYLNITLLPGNYLISYSYDTPGSLNYSEGNNSIVVTKQTLNIDGSDLVMLPSDGSAFRVTVTDKNGNPIEGVSVIFTVSGVSYTRVTNASGVASLNINLHVGYYAISYVISSDYFDSENKTNHILVNGTIIIAEDVTISAGSEGTFSLKLTDAQGNPLSGQTIRFYINGNTYYAVTNEEGIAQITISGLSAGEYDISYYYENSSLGYADNSGLNYVYIANHISFEDLISAANTVINYIEANYALPNSVTIAGTEYSMAQFLYLLAMATVNANNGIFDDLSVINVADPNNPVNASDLGNLYNYVSVAQSIINYITENGIAPNSISSDLGDIGFDGLIYALARVVVYYDNHGQMPNYVAIRSVVYSFASNPLNSINTISDLTPYLSATTNCQVGDSRIQALAASLTEGLTTDLEKATAIFNYVRDNISYQSYLNTHKGAVTTLTSRAGNCCDQAHLLAALCRASGLATRYVHGADCQFATGPLGHVWCQILIGDTWVVADPTSSRNSLGEVNNWSNHESFTLNGYYATLPF